MRSPAKAIVQALILMTGALAIWFTQSDTDELRRWACIAGLLGQPFWLVATWRARQWGMFGLSCFYAYVWIKGFNLYWTFG